MKVNDLSNIVRGTDPRDAQRIERQPRPPQETDTRSADGDALDLSASAKISISSAVSAETAELSATRLAEVQSRIATGFYSQPSIVEQTADQLLSFYSR